MHCVVGVCGVWLMCVACVGCVYGVWGECVCAYVRVCVVCVKLHISVSERENICVHRCVSGYV